MNWIPHNNLYENWMLLIVLLSLVGVAWIRYRHYAFIANRIKTLVQFKAVKDDFLENKTYGETPEIILFLLSTATLSLMVVQASDYFSLRMNWTDSGYGFLFIFAAVIVYYVVKVVFQKLLEWLIGHKTGIEEHIEHSTHFFQLSGFFLMPVMVLAVFTPESVVNHEVLFWMAGALVGLVTIVVLIKDFSIGLSLGISPFYIILYLCSLEILPLVVLIALFAPKIG